MAPSISAVAVRVVPNGSEVEPDTKVGEEICTEALGVRLPKVTVNSPEEEDSSRFPLLPASTNVPPLTDPMLTWAGLDSALKRLATNRVRSMTLSFMMLLSHPRDAALSRKSAASIRAIANREAGTIME